jgi:hypothetical protein
MVVSREIFHQIGGLVFHESQPVTILERRMIVKAALRVTGCLCPSGKSGIPGLTHDTNLHVFVLLCLGGKKTNHKVAKCASDDQQQSDRTRSVDALLHAVSSSNRVVFLGGEPYFSSV